MQWKVPPGELEVRCIYSGAAPRNRPRRSTFRALTSPKLAQQALETWPLGARPGRRPPTANEAADIIDARPPCPMGSGQGQSTHPGFGWRSGFKPGLVDKARARASLWRCRASQAPRAYPIPPRISRANDAIHPQHLFSSSASVLHPILLAIVTSTTIHHPPSRRGLLFFSILLFLFSPPVLCP